MKSAPYHHGSLREALLAAAATLLARVGLSGLTLRAAAREAGVSHAAPSHHFGDLTGLLTALATDGFRQLGDQLQAAIGAAEARRWDGARAYVAFASANTALFQLMFRSDRLNTGDPGLREARLRALGYVASAHGMPAGDFTIGQVGEMLGGWSLIHGFTLLLIDERLAGLAKVAPEGTTTGDLLEAMFVAADEGRIGPRREG